MALSLWCLFSVEYFFTKLIVDVAATAGAAVARSVVLHASGKLTILQGLAGGHEDGLLALHRF